MIIAKLARLWHEIRRDDTDAAGVRLGPIPKQQLEAQEAHVRTSGLLAAAQLRAETLEAELSIEKKLRFRSEQLLEASEVECRRLRAELVRTEADIRTLRNQIAARREAVA